MLEETNLLARDQTSDVPTCQAERDLVLIFN